MTHYATAPEDRIPNHHKLIYGLGAFVNNLLAAAIGGMIIVLNLGLGMNPALVGLLGALPRLTDAITDPLMGFISDNTRSRWGRRRPYILIGAITVGIIYALLWQLPADKSESFYFWYFLGGSLIFYLAYTIFATPWVALGYELTPDYHERTRLMGVSNFVGQVPYMIAPYFLAIMYNEQWFASEVEGAAGLAVIIGGFVIVVGIMPAIFLRERYQDIAEAESKEKELSPIGAGGVVAHNVTNFLRGFVITLKFKPFLKLCAATFLVFNGFILIAAFQSYVIIYYVFGGDKDAGATFVGHSGLVGAVSTLFVIMLVTWMATRIGKRRAFFVAIGISIVGYALKWFCYTPENPWLVLIPAPLMAFGLGGLFTLMGSMIADVVDADELQTHERREGMYGSIFWWVVKLGMAVAIAGGGFLLNATGFDVALEGNQADRTIVWMRLFDAFIPAAASAIAIWAIASYSITEDKAHEIRQQLEARRGN
ncbi:MAG: MFS transporter [Woeseiaceae bacterium]|nr:MFS transporter [Woeseiaceae bacterium]NIP21319.1 MFS transporter [Woeseiaceae bacterium]NIS90286.1 MFS transporter [Woeseiaceae bacterium]